jgi:outer membrane protein OmpA-like peptidoglycan-associated protein
MNVFAITAAALLIAPLAASTPGPDEAPFADAEITTTMIENATFVLDPETFPLDAAGAVIPFEVEEKEADKVVRRLTSDLLFAFDSAKVTPAAQKAIAALAKDVPRSTAVKVEGHTDAIGTDAYNLRLSRQRADAVAAVLKKARPDLKVTIAGRGESDPIASNDTPGGRALNRRVEISYRS